MNKTFLLILFIPFIFLSESYTIDFQIGFPSSTTFCGVFQGFGAEWDPFYWMSRNVNKGCDQAGWTLITNRIKELNVGIVRMWMQLYWCQTSKDLTNWVWDTDQMKSIFKYLDFCQQNNIDVILTDWGWSMWAGLKYRNPADIRYAKGMAYYLKEFIINRGYTCIKYFIIGNEPDKEMAYNYGFDSYIQAYQNLHQELINNGIRDKIKLIAPDIAYSLELTFMQNCIDRMKDILDGYDFHRYAEYNETSNFNLTSTSDTLRYHLDRWRDEVLARDPNGANKCMFVSEIGDDQGLINTFDFALRLADYGTTILTTRLQGASAWIMHDIWYYDQVDFLMDWGMWKYVDNGWALRPWSQSYGLLIKYAPRGSIQAPVNGVPPNFPQLSHYRCGAVKRPDGCWSIFLVNRENTSVSVNISLPEMIKYPFQKYLVDCNTFVNYPDTLFPPPVNRIPAKNNINIKLPPESFIVLVESQTIGSPAISVTPETLDFGEVSRGETKILKIDILNVGDGVLNGTLTTDQGWIKVDSAQFSCPSGNGTTINVTVDNSVLNQKEGEWTGKILIDSNGGTVTVDVILTATCVLVKPNPYNPNKGLLTFFGSGIVPGETTIKIYTLSGELVKKLTSKIGKEIVLDGKTDSGQPTTNGIYLYTYESPKEKGIGKFTVIKY